MNFRLVIYSYEKKLYDGQVSNVIVPGLDGEIGFLAYHISYFAPLTQGEVRIFDVHEHFIKIEKGYVRFEDNTCTIWAF